jgi:hypothetical protein
LRGPIRLNIDGYGAVADVSGNRLKLTTPRNLRPVVAQDFQRYLGDDSRMVRMAIEIHRNLDGTGESSCFRGVQGDAVARRQISRSLPVSPQ